MDFDDLSSSTFDSITSPTGTTFETEGNSSGSLVAPEANYILVASNNSVAAATSAGTLDPQIAAGEIVDCSVTVVSSTSVTITPKRDGLTFTAGAMKGRVYATCDHVGKSAKTKARVNAVAITAHGNINTPSIVLNSAGTATQKNNRLTSGHLAVTPVTGTQSLGVADVIRITNVIEASTTSGTTSALFSIVSAAIGNTAHDNNITSRYSFADGQKDNLYDHASITLKAGQIGRAHV